MSAACFSVHTEQNFPHENHSFHYNFIISKACGNTLNKALRNMECLLSCEAKEDNAIYLLFASHNSLDVVSCHTIFMIDAHVLCMNVINSKKLIKFYETTYSHRNQELSLAGRCSWMPKIVEGLNLSLSRALSLSESRMVNYRALWHLESSELVIRLWFLYEYFILFALAMCTASIKRKPRVSQRECFTRPFMIFVRTVLCARKYQVLRYNL